MRTAPATETTLHLVGVARVDILLDDASSPAGVEERGYLPILVRPRMEATAPIRLSERNPDFFANI